MANWFESIAKTLADDKLSRRQVVRKAAGVTVAVAVAAIVPTGEAFAAIPEKGGHYCKVPSNCSNPDGQLCQLKKYANYNCYCFQKIGTTTGVCGCNSYCASVPPCSSQANCASGYVCITNTGCGCTIGVCVQKCNKTCTLAANGAGRTAA